MERLRKEMLTIVCKLFLGKLLYQKISAPSHWRVHFLAERPQGFDGGLQVSGVGEL
jgi:hypothetical protein